MCAAQPHRTTNPGLYHKRGRLANMRRAARSAMSQQGSPPNRRQLPMGKIEVAPRAIAAIAARAVVRSYGVVGLAPHTLREGVAQVLHQRDAHKGVEVRLDGDAIEIDLYV